MEGLDGAPSQTSASKEGLVSGNGNWHRNYHGHGSRPAHYQREAATPRKEPTWNPGARNGFALDADHGQQGKIVSWTTSPSPLNQPSEGLQPQFQGKTGEGNRWRPGSGGYEEERKSRPREILLQSSLLAVRGMEDTWGGSHHDRKRVGYLPGRRDHSQAWDREGFAKWKA